MNEYGSIDEFLIDFMAAQRMYTNAWNYDYDEEIVMERKPTKEAKIDWAKEGF